MKMVKLWFKKSANDLKTAVLLSQQEDESYFFLCAFACQQSIEKSIKGFLAFHKIRFSKTHDLEVLTEQALKVEPQLQSLKINMNRISEFAVAYRYPDAELLPITKLELDKTIKEVTLVYNQLSNLVLPEDFPLID